MSKAERRSEQPEGHPVGTLFLTLVMLIIIIGIWLTVYFDMWGRG